MRIAGATYLTTMNARLNVPLRDYQPIVAIFRPRAVWFLAPQKKQAPNSGPVGLLAGLGLTYCRG